MSQRSEPIDALRGAAVLLVAQAHFLSLTGFFDWIGASALVARIGDSGGAGVDVFFVLSAYLLASGLARRGAEPGAVRTFYMRRAMRVLPLYWIVVAFGFGLYGLWMACVGLKTWLWAAPYPAWVYLAFLQNWFAGLTGGVAAWFGPTWSLAVEEQFYLLLPLMMTKLSARAVWRIGWSWIVLAPLIRLGCDAFVGFHAPYYWSICRLDSFGWGLVIALAPQFARRFTLDARLAGTAGAMLLLVVLALSSRATAFERSMTPSATGVAAALLTWSAAHGAGGANRALVWCGQRCYSLYLLQLPVLGLTFLVAGYIGPSFGVPYGPALVALAFAATLVLSDISYRRIEQPFMQRALRLAKADSAIAA
ncbi:MAG TPA: acyltransferase [Rhodoblastus sp.]|nr:acyltransferase [Rhodoblastus sp.]